MPSKHSRPTFKSLKVTILVTFMTKLAVCAKCPGPTRKKGPTKIQKLSKKGTCNFKNKVEMRIKVSIIVMKPGVNFVNILCENFAVIF